jgi:LysM repeat protein
MARTRVRFGRLGVLAALLLVSVTLVAQGASGTEPAGSGGGAVHVVEPGDTLWGLARSLVGDEGDPRPVVEQIRELNGLGTATIDPGMRLRLPSG